MTTSVISLPPAASVLAPVKKKRVLLVDASPVKRDLRAETMRKLGMDVDCAADISEARSWWRADLYNLVLINAENEFGHRDKFCEDVRGATPPQQLAFLVGKPEYLAASPNGDLVSTNELGSSNNGDQSFQDKATLAQPADAFGDSPLRWGILEASRRISAVRSLCHARSKAIRERPTPPRDLETRHSKRDASESLALADFQKEEMQ